MKKGGDLSCFSHTAVLLYFCLIKHLDEADVHGPPLTVAGTPGTEGNKWKYIIKGRSFPAATYYR